MDKLIAFCTHFSSLCMITSIRNIHIPSTPTAGFQRYNAINLRQINHVIRSENDVKFCLFVPQSFFLKNEILLLDCACHLRNHVSHDTSVAVNFCYRCSLSSFLFFSMPVVIASRELENCLWQNLFHAWKDLRFITGWSRKRSIDSTHIRNTWIELILAFSFYRSSAYFLSCFWFLNVII